MTKHHKKISGGGFWDSMKNSWSSLSQSASAAWNKTKKVSYDTYNSMTGNPTTTYYPTTYGGKKTRRHRGGSSYVPNTLNNNMASNAAPFSGKTAEPHHFVGGKHKKKISKKNKTYKKRQ